MSQRSEKLRRQVEKNRADISEIRRAVEEHGNRLDKAALWAAGMDQAALDITTERNAERRRARKAERNAATWRRIAIAYAALALVLVVELIAIAVTVSAREPEETAPPEPPAVETETEQQDRENEYIESALLAQAHVIEDCEVTHYDCCVQCCGKDDGITASGVRATPGVTVAVDPTVIPLGSDVLVDYGDGEIHYYRADDVGGAIKGNHIDLCVSDHQTAVQLGRRTATVYWVEADHA